MMSKSKEDRLRDAVAENQRGVVRVRRAAWDAFPGSFPEHIVHGEIKAAFERGLKLGLDLAVAKAERAEAAA